MGLGPACLVHRRRLLDTAQTLTRPFISILAAGACLFAACTTTRTIRRPETFEQLESMVWKKRAHIRLLLRDPEGATLLVPEPLTATAGPADGDAGVPLVVLPNLRGYEVNRRGLGALEGLGFGTAIGFVLGGLIGLAIAHDVTCRNGGQTCIAVLGTIGGQAIGTLIGAAVGHTDRYVFSDEPGQR